VREVLVAVRAGQPGLTVDRRGEHLGQDKHRPAVGAGGTLVAVAAETIVVRRAGLGRGKLGRGGLGGSKLRLAGLRRGGGRLGSIS
jgi:hypothetical protein